MRQQQQQQQCCWSVRVIISGMQRAMIGSSPLAEMHDSFSLLVARLNETAKRLSRPHI